MTGWRTLRGVVPNFLATYTSRYTDRDGWWLFGLAEEQLAGMDIDLLAPLPTPTSPRDQMIADAILRFREQLGKHRVPVDVLRSARLQIERQAERKRMCGSYLRCGSDYRFTVRIETNRGHHLVRIREIFVAPHAPELETRSARANHE